MSSVEVKLAREAASLRPAGGAEMDVLFVLNNLGVGGSERKIVRLANALSARDMRIGIAYLNEPTTLLKDIGENVATFFLSRQGRFSLKAHAALTDLIDEQCPRNLVSVNLYPALYVVTATRGARHRPRTIGLMNTTEMRRGAAWKRSFYMRVLRYLDWTVYGCELQRDAWLTADSPMRPQSSVIYNGVDLNRFAAARAGAVGQRAHYGIGENAFVVGSVGRLVAEKNQMPLVDAVADLRATGADVHLMLVGDGPLRSALEQRAAERGISAAITFTGALLDVRAALRTFDVFVLPSLSETFSNAALEAMAMQLPVILTRTGGASEMIEHGKEGYIVDVADLPQQLPELLDRLRLDNVLRTRMATAASARAQREFSWDAMLASYQSMFGTRESVSHA
ncbi:glycosyl transferase [Steroidobacter agaridevorans]|uniref:Glycosyl transferase n=1 Tax=Steroidobacter agaridevorans TaxID=2695856 RepID=A0A829YKU2_9GAMM|nr:glycosyl transferase [Steroidobacter agaridevorans]GFE91386.1 glycosyl transferase [Steroidobacter agaridevorans]